MSYTKHAWVTGETITAEKLNNIEDGVDDVTRHLSDLEDTVSTTQIINTASGAIASFSDGADSMPIRKLVAQIEPIQDLNGYANPWPAGGGKNKCDGIAYDGAISSNIPRISNKTPVTSPHNTSTGFGGVCFFAKVESGKTYALSSDETGSSATFYWAIYSSIDDALNITKALQSGNTNVSFTAEHDGYVLFMRYNSTAGTSVTWTYAQAEVGSSATAYAPYSNICPISGHTGAEIEQTGKNLLRLVESEMTNVGWDREFPFSIKAGTYTLSCQNKFVVNSLEGCQIELRDDGNNNIATITTGYNFGNVEFSKTSVITEEMANKVTNIMFQPRAGNCTFENIMDAEIMFEVGSTATEYEEYTGEAISVNWEDEAGTVYGGTATYNGDGTWTLVADKAMLTKNTATMDNSNDYPGWNASGIKNLVGANVNGRISGAFTNISPETAYAGSGGVGANTNGDNDLVLLSKMYFGKTQDEWVSIAMDVQILVPLATPLTYTITTSELIETLYGQNNVWVDTGSVSVEYSADTKLYIDNKITQAIAAALNA